MGVFTDAECPECGKGFKDGERVVVSTVSEGYYNAPGGNVTCDPYNENDIYHEKCHERYVERQACAEIDSLRI